MVVMWREPKKGQDKYRAGLEPFFCEYNTRWKKKRYAGSRMSVNESFLEEFSCEADIFDSKTSFPDWIYSYREEILCKITPPFRKLCRTLKDTGYDFKVKYPIEVGGRWKFADIFIPAIGLVVLLTGSHELAGLTCVSKTDRELFFSERYNTLAVECWEIGNVNEKIRHLG